MPMVQKSWLKKEQEMDEEQKGLECASQNTPFEMAIYIPERKWAQSVGSL